MSGRRGKPPEVPPRAFAIIPAAGESRRMGGVAKLLLPLQGVPLIAHALAAWQAAGIAPLVVVRRGDDQLAEVCRSYGAEVLRPETPPTEMKVSVQIALKHLQDRYRPAANFAWLLAPADMPRLSSAIIERLLTEHTVISKSGTAEILVPTIFDKPGHPVLFPWSLAGQVFQLAINEGVKAMLTRNPMREIGCDDLVGIDSDAFCDVDTPVDYQRLREPRPASL